MNRLVPSLIWIVQVTLLWVLFLNCSCSRSSSSTTPRNKTSIKTPTSKLEYIKIGETIPEIKTNDFNGQPITIASREDKEGQLIVIYAPTCDFCHATIPRWIELYRQFFL